MPPLPSETASQPPLLLITPSMPPPDSRRSRARPASSKPPPGRRFCSSRRRCRRRLPAAPAPAPLPRNRLPAAASAHHAVDAAAGFPPLPRPPRFLETAPQPPLLLITPSIPPPASRRSRARPASSKPPLPQIWAVLRHAHCGTATGFASGVNFFQQSC
ncbi:hypothetical protein B0H15DRAFT_807187 [Mycena belliarum]|uniref:Uncharacterized protein n=1 Tax=Mycena belliarum TaxID=1033014 RepID=A0AAD6XI42_9AGAR|nr:hypothetical protein B0H15DRAFT_807187 [Mycena belliae]